jgi:hypothetical protein
MYDIKQFRPVLYLVVLLGITGFCMAAESPGLWVFAVALLLVNAWLIKQQMFKPIPRIVSTFVTLAAFVVALIQFRIKIVSPILSVGQFLVLLQIVKVWEQRANRDFAQLLVLSLLLMVSAAISTASLLFGVLFIGYLLLSLYCCLLFHLKVEADLAREALSPALAKWGEGPVRQDQAHLSRSMRRLTALVAVFALFWAIVVFLFFPRNAGAGMFGQLQWKPKNTMTGFSEQVSFQNVAKISQNDDVVGTVKIWKGDDLQGFHEPIFLRGATHDYYNGSGDGTDQPPYQWSHTAQGADLGSGATGWGTGINPGSGEDGSVIVFPPENGGSSSAIRTRLMHTSDYRQDIELYPTGTMVLFALPGAVAVKPEDFGGQRRFSFLYTASDQTLRASEPLREPIRYEVFSTGKLGSQPPRSRIRSHIDPKIAEFARRPDVTGGLAQQRDAEVAARADKGVFYNSPLDEQIATRIETYLRRNYKYTLDLTSTDRLAGVDPMVAFLCDFKKGHCEYFAGAMTLLCQSLGMDARLVVGFKCDDFNDFGHFYTIRQSQAHAWVEVKCGDGQWKTFDPTSGISDNSVASTTLVQAKRFFDYLEYSWQNSVIAYNVDARDSLVQTAETKLNQTAVRGSQGFGGIKETMSTVVDWLASRIVGPLVGLLSLAIFGSVGWFFYERWKLRRRAARIGIVDLPASTQVKLMRQLGFYDDLVQLLERHGITRLPHHTSLEFCDSLAFLPSQNYDTIYRLTRLFYRIRYGQVELDAGQQRRLGNVIERLSRQMGGDVSAE